MKEKLNRLSKLLGEQVPKIFKKVRDASLFVDQINKCVPGADYHKVIRPMVYDIFSKFNQYLRDGDFYLCDKALTYIIPSSVSTEISLAILTITFAAKGKLHNRDDFYKKTEDYYKTIMDDKKCQRLLDGLK